MCMCVYMHMYIHTHTYTYTYIYINTYTYIYIYVYKSSKWNIINTVLKLHFQSNRFESLLTQCHWHLCFSTPFPFCAIDVTSDMALLKRMFHYCLWYFLLSDWHPSFKFQWRFLLNLIKSYQQKGFRQESEFTFFSPKRSLNGLLVKIFRGAVFQLFHLVMPQK